jgi:hypothetical protein
MILTGGPFWFLMGVIFILVAFGHLPRIAVGS